MKLTIVAESDRGIFVGKDSNGDYVVLGLDEPKAIDLDDELSSNAWDDSEGLFKTVRNLTKAEDVKICIENWSCSQALAYDFLRRLNSPKQIKSREGKHP